MGRPGHAGKQLGHPPANICPATAHNATTRIGGVRATCSSANPAATMPMSMGARICVGPQRAVERGGQHAHDRGIRAREPPAEHHRSSERVPEGERTPEQQERGQEDAHHCDHAADPPRQRDAGHGTQIACEGEQRSGHRLGDAIARQELALGHPARVDHRRLEQGQDHVATPEHERSRAEHGRQQAQLCQSRGQDGQRHDQGTEYRDGRDADAAWHGADLGRWCDRVRWAQPEPADDSGAADDGHLRERRDPDQGHETTDGRDQTSGPIGRQRSAHHEHRLSHHGHRRELEPMDPAGSGQFAGRRQDPQCDEDDGGRQREAEPRGNSPGKASTPSADGDAQLAAGRTGQHLDQGDEIRKADLVEPPLALDVLPPEVPQMCRGTTERCQAQAECRAHDLANGALGA